MIFYFIRESSLLFTFLDAKVFSSCLYVRKSLHWSLYRRYLPNSILRCLGTNKRFVFSTSIALLFPVMYGGESGADETRTGYQPLGLKGKRNEQEN